MSFKSTAAHSSRIKRSTKPPAHKRTNSSASPLPRRKPIQRSATKPEDLDGDENEDFFNDRLDDVGLVKTLATDLSLRDVPQAIQYIRARMFESIPEQTSGMNSTRIAEVLNFRASLPPVVTVSHVQALLNSPTAVEREFAELNKAGILRKIMVASRGGIGEASILIKDLDILIQSSTMDTCIKDSFMKLLHENPTALQLPRSWFLADHAKSLMHAGFLTASTGSWTSTDVFSRPGNGTRGTLTSLSSISKAASGSLAAIGGEGAVHAAGGSGGGAKLSGTGDFSLAVPNFGSLLKVLSSARAHLLSLLGKSKYHEYPESLLRQRWDGGISANDAASAAKKYRGEFTGVPLGRTRKWKQFYGITFDFIVGECVGAGLVEVFNTASIGRGIRAL